MTKSRLHAVIALGLFVLGIVVYFWSSDAPARVHFVIVPLQLLFLVGGVGLASQKRLRPLVRFLICLAFVALFAAVWSYSVSLVVLKIEPFDSGFLFPLMAAFGVELAMFVGVVWLLGAIYRRVFERQRSDPATH